MAEQDRETLNFNRDKFEKFSKDYEKFSNSIYVDVTKVLITLSTALLAFTSPLVSFKILTDNSVLKTILVVVWCLLGLSVLAGIIELLINHYYFNKISTVYDNMANICNSGEASETGVKKVFEEIELESRKNFKSESWPVAFYFQIFFFLSSLVLLIIIFARAI